MTPYVAVVGGTRATPEQEAVAEEVGRLLAQRGAIVVCGGRAGVTTAVSRGAAGAGGMVVGLLPGTDRAEGNEWLTVALPTGIGELRNGLIVRAADVVIAIGGAYGTLSEVALALESGRRVIGLGFAFDVEGVEAAADEADAVSRALGG